MQQTDTALDWRSPENLAPTNQYHHIRYANPDQDLPHRRHHGHPSALHGRSSRLCCIHHTQLHHSHRLQAAYCSSLLSRIKWQTLGTSDRSTIPQRQHTSCATLTSRTSRSIAASDLWALQRTTTQLQQLSQLQPLQPLLQPKHCQEQLQPHQPHQHQQRRTRNDGRRVLSVRLRPAFRLPRSQMPPMQKTAPPTDRTAQGIRAIVSHVVPPQTSIVSVQLLPHHSLQQVYEVSLSETSRMLVSLPPLPIIRLMRSEQNMPISEAVLITWLREELLHPSSRPSTTSASTAASPNTCTPERQSPGPSASAQSPMYPRLSGCKAGLNVASVFSSSVALRSDLLRYIPLPVSLTSSPPPASLDGTTNATISSSSHPLTFNVFQPTAGTTITSLASPLTPAERMAVDYQAGKLIRQLSQLSPQSGSFGPALAVLSPQSLVGPGQKSDIMIGTGCWSVAFHAILEGALRDGEDVSVQLPYPTVRKHFRRLGHLLDTVTTPSLVVVDAMDDTNLLVERLAGVSAYGEDELSSSEKSLLRPGRSASPTSLTAAEALCTIPDGEENVSTHANTPRPPSPSSSPREARAASSPPFAGASSQISVTGFRDWSRCIFGDPLFASVFCNQPSTPFLNGFNSTGSDGSRDDRDEVVLNPLEPHAAHEETEYKSVRLLLYQCYHAIVQIVRSFYHPGRDRTTQELAARKRLNEILARLDAVDEDPKKRFRHRRPSGEMSPAKKPRSESGDETPKR